MNTTVSVPHPRILQSRCPVIYHTRALPSMNGNIPTVWNGNLEREIQAFSLLMRTVSISIVDFFQFCMLEEEGSV